MTVESTINLAAILTASTTWFIFIILHFVIEPRKEKKRIKEEKLKNLYAPLFTMIINELVSVPVGVRNTEKEMVTLTKTAEKFLADKDHFVNFVLNNSRYASTKLLFEIHSFVETVMLRKHYAELDDAMKKQIGSQTYVFPVDNLVKTIVKDYNQLRKELEEEYNEEELMTGVPEIIKQTKK
ncbi:hypothetical protein BTH38_29350 [Bacillus toyonensis]|uniref:hypothetical protein n=1 Tax=Bacillus toyonensis TaxID=155322 RepID=UPI000A19C540|nr:hypothetical protein [Bacillus toyonensis]OSM09684.1 hypothetical protein BTH38_29350 [Bacillus toyonensis]